ncbi:pentapeptide repeat-containing protein [Nocardia sp. NPDC005825]|uniref:pentapeptide repeat-containing protein n=1 Tax=unclassified Nocardia TaxID=2637762 RepID=UPI0033D231F4
MTRFDGATFTGTTTFDGATLSGVTRFRRARFAGPIAWFARVTFPDTITFDGAILSGIAWFEGTSFSSGARFQHATFLAAEFNGVTFSGTAGFGEVEFATAVVSFASPRRWGPPDPEFDWDQDASQKPRNVEPQDWPQPSP